MFIPNNQWTPSTAVRARFYDEEGKLLEFKNEDQGDAPALGEANSLFATEAEQFGSIAPFLKANRINDAKRRNYIIQPGGACMYFQEDKPLADPYGGGRVQYTAPDPKEVFGHNSMDGSKLADPNGRRFSLAGRGSSSSGR